MNQMKIKTMLNFKLKLAVAVLITAVMLLVPGFSQAQNAMLIDNFTLSPSVIIENTGSTQFQMSALVIVSFIGYNSECGENGNSFEWTVTGGSYSVSGEEFFERTPDNPGSSSPVKNISLDENITINTTQSAFSGDFSSSSGVDYTLSVYCPGGTSAVATSDPFNVVFGVSDKTWACIDENDNTFLCDPYNFSDCSKVSEKCIDGTCQQIGANLCDQPAGDSGYGGGGGDGDGGGDGGDDGGSSDGGSDGTSNTFTYSFDNPLEADDLVELLDVIATWLFNISIPVTVAMILYAGIMFLISRGDTTKVAQAKKILLYTVIGFTIILIGKGFITLIESILNLGTTP